MREINEIFELCVFSVTEGVFLCIKYPFRFLDSVKRRGLKAKKDGFVCLFVIRFVRQAKII